MCEFCSKHKRKKWFLDPDNYEEKLLENKKRKNILQKISGWGLEYYMRDSVKATKFSQKPIVGDIAKKIINKVAKFSHAGQVVTLEDALKIIDLADNHIAFECYCRKLSGLESKMCCVNFGPMRDLVKNANPNEKMEEVDSAELTYRLKEWHTAGLFTQVLYAAAPFPIAICNCERRYCFAFKERHLYGVESSLMKGHEVAYVNPIKCKASDYPCVSRCQFGAMYVDRYDNTVVVDPTKCFGCGLCITACKYDAIRMEPRINIFKEKGRW
ncbi:MAG: 4Fe-4S binding protein [Candidatus Altiarchaeota archaeon]